MLKHFLKNFAATLLSISLVSNCWAGIDFDGTDDFVNLGNTSSLNFSGINTMAIYVKLKIDSFNTTVSPYIEQLVGNEDGLNAQWLLRLGDGTVGGADNLTFTLYAGGFKNCIDANNLSINTEYTVIANYDGSNMKIWVNGNNNATLVESGNINGTHSASAIGAMQNGQRNFDGIIREVAVWNTYLTTQEIDLLTNSKLRNMPNQIKISNLKGYWIIDDQETGTSADTDNVRDLSGNGNNGTGDNGANNTGLSWAGESILSYQPIIAMFGGSTAVIAAIPSLIINGTVFIQNMIVQ